MEVRGGGHLPNLQFSLLTAEAADTTGSCPYWPQDGQLVWWTEQHHGDHARAHTELQSYRVTDCSSPSSIVNQAVCPTINKVYDCYMKSPPGQRCFRSWLLGDPWESQLITWPGLQPKHPSPTPFPCSSPKVSKTAPRVKALAAKHDDASSIPYGPMW